MKEFKLNVSDFQYRFLFDASTDKFIEWIEANGWKSGGGLNEPDQNGDPSKPNEKAVKAPKKGK